jgi:hypothetical protein
MNATIVATIAIPNTIVTTRPEVVRESSRTMHAPGDAVEEAAKQIIPGAHEAVEVSVGVQVVFPRLVLQTVVEKVEVMEQIKEVPGVLLVRWIGIWDERGFTCCCGRGCAACSSRGRA